MDGSSEARGLQTAPHTRSQDLSRVPNLIALVCTKLQLLRYVSIKIVSAGNEEKGHTVLQLIQKKRIPSREQW